ncbi:hypothetical protein [Burkholderia sp. S-53]|uniref:hypothetical protein n=1 Tax=Burkholderia sp. S-53 TaxID=2906514 RepID=UPI0021D35931|nr:hypothetical protein [Burkholderia sp. S-53]UXU85553.1 hypothetical protein LXM88_04100 [Burkholderia sp. S-53]
MSTLVARSRRERHSARDATSDAAMRGHAVAPRMPADAVALHSLAAECAVFLVAIDLRHDRVSPDKLSSLFFVILSNLAVFIP